MKVITDNPVYVDNTIASDADLYMSEWDEKFESGFDSSNSFQVKAFQNWLDVKYPTWFNGGKLSKDVSKGYGTYNDITKSADSKYGKEFDEAMKKFSPTAQAIQTSIASPISTKTEIVTEDFGSKDKKNKKLMNILIISGIGVVVLGLFIALVRKK